MTSNVGFDCMIIRRNFPLVAFLFFLFFTGCKSLRKVATVESGAAKAHMEFFNSVHDQAFKFETFGARINAGLSLPKGELSSRVDLKIIKDSIFQLSVQPILGIEVFRVMMNRDSILVIDRMNRRYLMENYENIRKQTPIAFNFYNLQSLFINHIFLPGEREVGAGLYNRFMLAHPGIMAEAKVKDKMGLQYLFTIDGEEKLMATYISDEKENNALQWSYADFREAEGQVFPMLMDVLLMAGGKVAGEARFSFSRIQTNEPMQLDFSVPQRYTQATFAQLLKSLSGGDKK